MKNFTEVFSNAEQLMYKESCVYSKSKEGKLK